MRRRAGRGRSGGALGQHPVLGRRLAEDVDAERLGQVEPLGRVEAALVDRRRGAGQPGREEDVAGRLRPARGGRAPDQLAGARAEPVLGLGALAGQVAVGVDDAARLAGGAGGEDDQRRVLGVHLLDRGRASPAGGPRRAPRRPRPGSSPAPRRAARRADPRRRRRAPAPRRSRAARGRGGAAAGVQGRATAPIRQQASSVSAHSIRLPTRVMTTSPRRTPRAAKAPESPAERAISSPKCQSRRLPSASTATIPSREAGERSITSSTKFTRGSLPQCCGGPEAGPLSSRRSAPRATLRRIGRLGLGEAEALLAGGAAGAGAHQFHSPKRRISEGTSRARTIVASIITPNAIPIAICLTKKTC